VGFVVNKVELGQDFSGYFSSPQSIIALTAPPTSGISRAGMLLQVLPEVPSGLNLSASYSKKYLKIRHDYILEREELGRKLGISNQSAPLLPIDNWRLRRLF
jgi:hypothetical protein